MFFDFTTKTINPNKAPIRIQFQLLTAISSTNFKIKLGSQFSWNSNANIVGFIRCYYPDLFWHSIGSSSSVSVINQEIELDFIVGLPGLATVWYELVIETIEGDSNEDPHFTWPTNAGDEITFTILDGTTTIYESTVPVYPYAPVPYVKINKFYYTTLQTGNHNSLIFDVTADFDGINDPSFPNVLLEFEFTSGIPFTSTSRIIPCGVSFLSKRALSSTIRCSYFHSQHPRIRVEGFDQILDGTNFHIIFYDIDNTKIAHNSIGYFDAKLIVTTASGYRSQSKMTRLFNVISGTSHATTTPMDFPQITNNIYGQETTLYQDLIWEDSCYESQCRFIIQGKSTGWKFKDEIELEIGNSPQSIILDKVANTISKLFIFEII